MAKDLIIGCFTNYDWDKIKFWVNSIDESGFTGDKAMLVYNSDFQTVQKLIDKRFMIYAFNKDDSKQMFFYPGQLIIVVQRFIDLYKFMGSLDLDSYRYVIHTDVKDVVFQRNPSEWLDDNMGDSSILASCESLRYRDEPWGNDNLKTAFPMVYDDMKDLPIWNCGVQAGKPSTMRDLWLQIYMHSVSSQVLTNLHNPDQASYNVILNSEAYRKITKFVMSEDGWACQAGTTMDPTKIDGFKPNLLEPQPTWDGKSACTSLGKKHYILHQYDRIPEWKKTIEGIYG